MQFDFRWLEKIFAVSYLCCCSDYCCSDSRCFSLFVIGFSLTASAQDEREKKEKPPKERVEIKPEEKKELDFFQQVYGVALLRKAEGIYEAVQRNLIKSPADLNDA